MYCSIYPSQWPIITNLSAGDDGVRRPPNASRRPSSNPIFVKLSIPNFDHSQLLPSTSYDSTMPPKEKQKAGGSSEKKKPTPKAAPAKPAQEEVTATREGRMGKPDQTAYQAEQDVLKKEIDELTIKFVCPRPFYLPAKGLLTPCTFNGRMPSRIRLTVRRGAPGTNEEMN